MIDDSFIWKDELKKELKKFCRFAGKPVTTLDEHYSLRLEKFFFISAFIIRKLKEANKLSDELENKDFNCIKYQRIRKEDFFDQLNAHRFNEFYNLEKEEKSFLKLEYLCNILIHSFVFNIFLDDNYILSGIFINSDRTKDEFLFQIELNTFIELINNVIDDDIVDKHFDRRVAKTEKGKRNICVRKSRAYL